MLHLGFIASKLCSSSFASSTYGSAFYKGIVLNTNLCFVFFQVCLSWAVFGSMSFLNGTNNSSVDGYIVTQLDVLRYLVNDLHPLARSDFDVYICSDIKHRMLAELGYIRFV